MSDFENTLFEALDAVAIGGSAPIEHKPQVIEEPDYIPLRPIGPCTLCGVPTVWQTERKRTPVHPRCVRDYLRRKAA